MLRHCSTVCLSSSALVGISLDVGREDEESTEEVEQASSLALPASSPLPFRDMTEFRLM